MTQRNDYKPEDYPRPLAGLVLPGRTKSSLNVRAYLSPSQLEAIERGEAVDVEITEMSMAPAFQCIDCGYETREVSEICEHQEHQERYHTWRQRLRRWSQRRRMQ